MGVSGTFIASVAILGALLIPISAILAPVLIVWLILRMANKGEKPKNVARLDRQAQDIHDGLKGLSKRVEALETILLDRIKRD